MNPRPLIYPARLAACALAFLTGASGLVALQVDPAVRPDNGRLHYRADERGNRVPDFSYAGYRGGGVPLPNVPAVVVVAPAEGDDGARIQAALDHVSELPLSETGVRGAVQLLPGRYEVAGSLRISASGVVLRGAGSGEDGTLLVAAGNDRRTLIEVFGSGSRQFADEPVAVSAEYVPVASMRLPVASGDAFSVGDRVRIHRPSTEAWIEAVGMEEAPARTTYKWRPGQWDMFWDRKVTAVEGGVLVLDAPITTALEERFGGATVQVYEWPDRIREVGVEGLRLVSEFDPANPQDEEHSWIAIQLDRVEDAWVSDVVGIHFVSSIVHLGRDARAVTVMDCASLAPVSEVAGFRRHSFHTSGQLTLFLRCHAEDGQHDFTAGDLTTGPNVFLESRATLPHGFSGSVGSWASGLLFDNVHVDGGALRLDNLEIWNQGVGWNAANSMIWQASASVMVVRQPPTATNWAQGVWAQFIGDGQWMQTSQFANLDSLYRAQLAERLGGDALAALAPRDLRVEEARPLEEAVPDLARRLAPKPAPEGLPLQLENGWLVADDRLLFGRERSITWWRGSVLPARAGMFGSNITRFAPGMTGPGLTDDLGELAASMKESNEVAIRHHYGLWYDRRRDDHEMTRRIDANVAPPFFELPWARSGKGETWNRLSRYDLTKFNPWYFRRLGEFAEEARQTGLVLINEMYFQHNILESGGHWVDFPWRPVNALQKTDFPEPPPYRGDTIVMADRFYDVTHPLRRELHRLYIRKTMESLAEHPNVLHTVSAEFTGPLHFVEFWLDVIGEWQEETGHDPLIALSTTKDVQDAILADPQRSRLIDVIDFTYWHRTESGSEFAPQGGLNLAPRQHSRGWRGGGRTSASSVAGMVAEYRQRFPEKAIISSLPAADGWRFMAAGGSFPRLPAGTDPRLLEAVARMQPLEAAPEGQWTLADGAGQFLIVRDDDRPIVLDRAHLQGRSLEVWTVNPEDGSIHREGSVDDRGSLRREGSGLRVVWLNKPSEASADNHAHAL